MGTGEEEKIMPRSSCKNKMRYTLTRDQQTQGYEVYKQKEGLYQVFMQKIPNGGLLVKGFAGKADKYSFFYKFVDAGRFGQTQTAMERTENYVNAFIEKLEAHQASIIARREARKVANKTEPKNPLKIGDIVEHSGGYNCTQTQFYKIVGFNKTGKKAEVVRLNKTQVDGDWMNGNVAPVDSYDATSKRFTFMVKGQDWNGNQMLRGGEHYIENFYKWNGKPVWNNCD
jgi:hypothetical protein